MTNGWLKGGMRRVGVALAVLALCGGMDAAAPAATFAESKTLAVQIALDRRGFSCNTIDGQWGAKSQVALATYCAIHGYADKEGWAILRKRAMECDNSWGKSANEYLRLYKSLLK